MKTRSLIKTALVVIAISFAIYILQDPPGSMFECRNSVIDCMVAKGLKVFVLIVGGGSLAKDKVIDRLSSGTPVKVIDENGRQRMGRLSHTAIKGRDVKSGDTVWINCKPSQSTGGNSCYLDFVEIDPSFNYDEVNQRRYGPKPSWHISIDAKGNPDSSLLKYEP